MSEDLLELSGAPADDGAPEDGTRRRGRSGARLRVFACLAVVMLALAWVAIRGLTGNFVYYLTPSDIVAHHEAQAGRHIRLGGYVVPGSVHHSGPVLTFTITDRIDSIQVSDTGPVPELFRAGQGVVLEGALGKNGRFYADTTLVQHNGTYAPPKPGAPPPHRADLKLGA